ncbi:MAG: DUF177 domain-containing protein [Muribaculaceae bacterium]|nr:DUF177 domain-containing protein [Muribaculaceae bacterium]
MCDLKQFIIALPSLGEGHHEYEMKVDGDFFAARDNDDVKEADVTAYVDIDVHHGVYEIGITCQGWIDIPCDRCLDPMRLDVDEDYDVTVRYGEEYDEKEDTIIIPESEVNFDLSPLVADTILLSIPLRHVHPAGECNPEMEEIMSQHSSESVKPEDDDI